MQSSQFIEEAIDQHGDTVFRLACSMLDDIEAARDVTQDTFVKLFQSDIVFEHDGHLRGWLITVARNACHDVLRRERRVAVELIDPTQPDALERLMADRAQLSESAIALDKDDYLWHHVAQLPLAERTAVFLRYAEDIPVAEIAEICGKSRPYVRAQLSRARRKLRKMIEAERKQRKEEKQHEMAPREAIRDLSQAGSITGA